MNSRKSGGLISQLRDFGVGPIIGMFISLITVPITTRIISPEEFGKSALFTLFQTIFTLSVLLGLDQSYVRFYNKKDIDKKDLLVNSMLIPLFFCVLFLLFFLFFSKKISLFIFGQNEPLIILSLFLFLPALLFNRFAFLSLRMDLRGKVFSFLNVLQQVINFITLIILLLYYEKSFRSIIFATIVSTTISTIIAMVLSKQFVFNLSNLKIDRKLIRDLLLFGLPLLPAALLSWVLSSFDKIALRTWSSFEELGFGGIQ
ncbi:MAG TPA: oligosaccharide flippase family protein [Clostridiales bacterium]|nr:oligosaccharide flippase family protein [Clostridiales bacterium]